MSEEATDSADGSATEPPTPEYPVLDAPAEGVPEVIQTEAALMDAADALSEAHGPVALDAERASGYRYGSQAYLVQLRREGAGSFLIDPIACPDLAPVQKAIGDAEWVLHAATQDLPCLRELGLHPTRLFDTELGSRLAGLPRVALATVVEHYLGVTLAKEHSAVDWSTRPLPEPWLLYAALDVEVLVQVRDRLRADLQEQGKLEWALQDFEALAHFTGPARRTDPWRRTSGMHRIRNRRASARVRELWLTRDAIAQRRDVAPGRVLPDALLIAMADQAPTTPADLQALGQSTPTRSKRGRTRPAHRGLARHQRDWLEAIRRVAAMPETSLPAAAARHEGPPPARAWADRDPVAGARLAQVRADLEGLSEQYSVPTENLLTPSVLRRVLWQPQEPLQEITVRDTLADLGARAWQIDLVTPRIMRAVADHPPQD